MKKKRIKSAIPIYGAAAVWLLLGLICPKQLLKLWFDIVAAVLSGGAYFGLSKVFKGREIEVRDAANSGDKTVDALIEEGRKQLDSLREANRNIPDPEITRNLDRMVTAGEGIFNVLEKDTKQAVTVRRFMNYYLPTADKLMKTYQMMMETQAKSGNIQSAMHSVENSLSMIAAAFEKQLDNLYKDRALDIDTDIDVLETIMASEGLIRNDASIKKQSTPAAEEENEGQTAQAGN